MTVLQPPSGEPTLSTVPFKRILSGHWRINPAEDADKIEEFRWRQQLTEVRSPDLPIMQTPHLYFYGTFTAASRSRTGTGFRLKPDWLNLFNPHGLTIDENEAIQALCGQLNALMPSLMVATAERTLELRLTPLSAVMIRAVRRHIKEVRGFEEIIREAQTRIQASGDHLMERLAPLLPASTVTAALNHHFKVKPGCPLRLQWAQRPEDLLMLTSPEHLEHHTEQESDLPWGEISASGSLRVPRGAHLTPSREAGRLTPVFITRPALALAQTDEQWPVTLPSAAVKRSEVDAARPFTLGQLRAHLNTAQITPTCMHVSLIRAETTLINATLEQHTITNLTWEEGAEHPAALAEALIGALSKVIPDLDHDLKGEAAEHWFRYWALA